MRIRDHVIAWLNRVSPGTHVEKKDQRICVAAAEYMAHRLEIDAAAVRPTRIPEDDPKTPTDRRVDLLARVGWMKVAFEHTQVESFENQIRDGHHVIEFGNQVRGALPEALPPGHFTLTMATGAVFGLAGEERDQLAADLAGMIGKGAQGLARQERGFVTLDVDHVGGVVKLGFRPGGSEGLLSIARWVPENLEDRRLVRIQRSLRDKSPKLAQWRSRSYRTCLVLEDQDLSLANPDVLLRATRAAYDTIDEPPDWIVVIETPGNVNLWWSIIENGSWAGLDETGLTRIDP